MLFILNMLKINNEPHKYLKYLLTNIKQKILNKFKYKRFSVKYLSEI